MNRPDLGQGAPDRAARRRMLRLRVGDASRGAGRPPLAVSAGSLVAARVAVAAFGWGGTILIARELGREAFGQFTLVFGLLGMLSIITDLGVGRVALRGMIGAGEDAARYAGSYVVLRACLGLVGYGVVLSFVTLSGYPAVVIQATAVAGLVVVLATPSHAYEVAFQATDRLTLLALASIVGQMAQLALTVALVFGGGTLVWLTVPAVAKEALVLLWKAPMAHRLVEFRYLIDRRIWGQLFREAVPLSLGTAMVTLYYRLDFVMLSKLDDFAAVGVYGVAYKFADVAHFVPSAVSVAILASLVRAWPDDADECRTIIRRAASLLAVVGGLVITQVVVFAPDVLDLLYGNDYATGAAAARILILGEGAAFLSSLAFACLVATGRHRGYPIVTLTGLAVNVVLNIVLIPRYSFEGAAYATLVTEVLVAILMWRLVASIAPLRPLGLLPTAKVIPLAIVSGLVGLAVASVAPWLVGAAVTTGCYLALAHLARLAGPGGLRALVTS